jgi:hypothetical protein
MFDTCLYIIVIVGSLIGFLKVIFWSQEYYEHKIDKSLNKINKQIDNRIDNLNDSLKGMNERVDKLYKRVSSANTSMMIAGEWHNPSEQKPEMGKIVLMSFEIPNYWDSNTRTFKYALGFYCCKDGWRFQLDTNNKEVDVNPHRSAGYVYRWSYLPADPVIK